MDADLASPLRGGCEALGVAVDDTALQRLLDYLALLDKWNRSYNLTAVRDPRQMVTRHLLDCLAVAPHLWGARVLDVGSGAGLPGVPLAVVDPDRTFHLLDSSGKKTRFLFQVKTALGLDNMVIQRTRVEDFRPGEPFDTVLSRAFATLEEMVSHCRHLLSPTGRMLAMKGARPEGELRDLAGAQTGEPWRVAVLPLEVPGLMERRHLVDIRPPAGRH